MRNIRVMVDAGGVEGKIKFCGCGTLAKARWKYDRAVLGIGCVLQRRTKFLFLEMPRTL